MLKKHFLSAALIFAASLPLQLHASTFDFTFKGSGVNGWVELTYGTTTDSKYSNAFEVTKVTGWITDTNNGLNVHQASIGALAPLKYDTPEPGNELPPHDFSRFPVASGLQHGSLSYDNLFWPAGSAQTASDYPVSGGFLDIYGLLFDIGGGQYVNIWSNGFVGGPQADYGFALVTSQKSLDYIQGGVAVSPEPSEVALLGSGLLGLSIFAWRRRSAKSSAR
jgi:hypothetical protein